MRHGRKTGLPADLNLRQDEDVLETWFSSALWTFGTLGWPDDTEELSQFHPTDVLVTGHDIIFFWVARMIMMTLKFTGQIPFERSTSTGWSGMRKVRRCPRPAATAWTRWT